MRAFVVLCLITVVAAQYDYAPQTVTNSEDGGYSGGVSSGAAQLSQPIQQQETEYNKEFYSYSAPEQEFQDAGDHEKVANSLKKNLRVIFIRGPENHGLENAALQLAKSASDDRTAIYVLQKQADVSDLANKLNQVHHNSAHKPEVHFVKYRTQADADNAQRTIQSQYDALPGPSSNTHGGQAQVFDFASKTPARPVAVAATAAAPSSQYIPPQPQASYLPPGRRF